MAVEKQMRCVTGSDLFLASHKCAEKSSHVHRYHRRLRVRHFDSEILAYDWQKNELIASFLTVLPIEQFDQTTYQM